MHCLSPLSWRLALLLVAVLAVGCGSSGGSAQAQADPDQPQLSPAEMVEAFERGFRQDLGPAVRVGYVEALVGDTRVASISDVDTSGLAEGAPLMFFDARGNAVAFGQILSVDNERVLAEFEPEFVANGRLVRRGDFAAFNLSQ